MKMMKTILMAATLFAGTAHSDNPPAPAPLPQPYASVRVLPSTPYYLPSGYILVDLVKNLNGTVFIDVGSQDGSVARMIAQNNTGVQVYSVSMWQSCDTSVKHLFQKFLSNVIAENTYTTITPIRMSSLEAAKALNITADVIYLDCTSSNLSAEILAWEPRITKTGTICGRDWSDASTQASVAQAADKLGLTVVNSGDFWYLVKQ